MFWTSYPGRFLEQACNGGDVLVRLAVNVGAKAG
ncbi:hypothetical protein FBZ98_11474 [Rhizobium sp. ERR 922]|nr:hypothetical protein FBZ99_11929 [Rhizobium sp. ERR1071]TWB45661.1 hypothetical protein FBZ98_11474 [Rhizobium sp. ERR 922]TWB88479.1 hypothetical protein FBZ97_11310 [Rhizobium sp. ERR 942]